jgi:hypothetical protein
VAFPLISHSTSLPCLVTFKPRSSFRPWPPLFHEHTLRKKGILRFQGQVLLVSVSLILCSALLVPSFPSISCHLSTIIRRVFAITSAELKDPVFLYDYDRILRIFGLSVA